MSQPVLRGVMIWFFILPYAIHNLFWTFVYWNQAQVALTPDQQEMLRIIIILEMIVLGIVMTCSSALALTVSKRILTSRAGRARSSLSGVWNEGRPSVIPLLLTGVLRFCFICFWGLLLIVPGVIYAIRTMFYDVVIVGEGKSYRGALKRSKAIVHGHTWAILWRYCLLFLLLPIAVNALTYIGYWITQGTGWPGTVAMDIVDAVLNGPAMLLLIISTVLLYKATLEKHA